MKSRALLVASFLVVPGAFAQNTPGAIESAGRIEAVTVYRGQALVTRVLEVPGGEALADAAGGVREIIVTDLPPRVRGESLHAETTPNVKVRSVRFRARPVVEDTRTEVRALDSQLEQLNDQLNANRRRQELLNEHRAYLASLQGFVAPTATAELTRGVLNAETLQTLSTFLRNSRDDLVKAELSLQQEAKGIQRQAELAQRERDRITAGGARTVYEAVLLVDQAGGSQGTLRLRYLVDGATWEPSYAARTGSGADPNRESMTLEYFASIQQMSGEDWNNVTMTLSTATPSLIAAAPRLSPMAISLASAPAPAQTQGVAYADARKDLWRRQREAEEQRSNNRFERQDNEPSGGGGAQVMLIQPSVEFDQKLNTLANDLQVLDLIAGEKVSRDKSVVIVPREEGLSVTYTIPTMTSLPSRADRQQVQIASVPMKASFAKIAAPVLTGYVYDEASAVNTSTMVLLAGPVTAYADGAFVGGGDLPTITAGERLTTGFGIDSSLRTTRALVERSESIQGGNRVVDLTYRLSVENFGSSPAPVRLLERLPKVEGNRSDIKLTVISTGQPLSDDAEYVKGTKRDGILRWDVVVPPGGTGQNALTVEYTFRLEYDKQMNIVGLGG